MIKLNAGQAKALPLLTSDKIFCILKGGSRSGKTFLIVYSLIVRALKAPFSEHLIVRLRFAHIKQSVWHKTIPDVMRICFPNLKPKFNNSDFFITFSNGARIWIAGIDDKERMEKILGNEYDSIFINEASEIKYDAFDILKSRLNAIHDLKAKMYVDYNPPSKSHWSYKLVELKEDPVTGQKINWSDKIGSCLLNPEDNKENLAESYFEILDSMTEKQKKRFKYGLYGDDTEGALWKMEWIVNNRMFDNLPDFIRVVVAIDPAVSNNPDSDETGIAILAKSKIGNQMHYFVLGDESCKGSPLTWATVACTAYKEYEADLIIGEVNQGGDLVEMNIKQVDSKLKFKPVRATRGKAVRAEPIAALYEKGLVHHIDIFQDLEDQLCSWVPESGMKSPDRLDAVVWGLSYLAGQNLVYTGASSVVFG